MIVVRDANYDADEVAIRSIRFEVFVDEQHVPADLEMDDRDRDCIHVLAFEGARPVATGRVDLHHAGKIGRVAVLKDVRRRGVGRAVMARLHEIAREKGLAGVWCHAQVSAVPFYERLGYRPTGPVFVEAGIDHVKMTMPLQIP